MLKNDYLLYFLFFFVGGGGWVIEYTNLGILAQVSDAQAIAFSFPHQATALEIQTKVILIQKQSFNTTTNVQIIKCSQSDKQNISFNARQAYQMENHIIDL